MAEEPTIEILTRAEIRAQLGHFYAEERDLLAQVIALEKTAGAELTAGVLARNQKIRDRARAKLNGHAAQLLQPVASRGNLSETRIELEAVRLIQQVLSKKAVEAEAIEVLERAEKLAPAEAALAREWALVTAKWLSTTKRFERFYDQLDQGTLNAMRFSGLPAVLTRKIQFESMDSAEELLARVQEAAAASAADLRKARPV